MKKTVIGVIIMMLGTFLLLNNMGFFIPEVYHLVISWQALLIVIGVILLFDRSSDQHGVGIALIVIGTLFLLPKIFSVSVSGIIIPLLIIAAGIGFILKAATGKKEEKYFSGFNRWNKNCNDYEKDVTINKEGIIRQEYVFSTSKEKWTQGKLKNVEIESVFSGVEIDLTQAELADDVKVAVHIKVKSVFGAVILYVPEDWNITVQKTGVFGGFTDNRPKRVLQIASNKLVILELEAVFGGGEIRCYE